MDGVPQEMQDFAAQTEVPLTLALLVDTSRSMTMVLDYERCASVAFLKNAPRPEQDRATVFHFDSEVQMLCSVEGPGQALARAVNKIDATPLRGALPLAPERSTALYDAIVEASSQLQTVPGRKAMIVLTDGIDVMSKHSLDQAVESALRSDTAVYSILVSPAVMAPPSRPRPTVLIPRRNQILIRRYKELNLAKGRAALSSISSQTGGHQFEVAPGKSVKSIYAAITDELRKSIPPWTDFKGEDLVPGYHSLLLVTTASGAMVQTRRVAFSGRRGSDAFQN